MPGMSRAVKRRNLAVVKPEVRAVRTRIAKPAAKPIIEPEPQPEIIAPRQETPPATDAEETPAPATVYTLQQITEELRKLSKMPLNAVSRLSAQNLITATAGLHAVIRRAEYAIADFFEDAEDLPRQFAAFAASATYEQDTEWNYLRDSINDFAKSADEMFNAIAALIAADS